MTVHLRTHVEGLGMVPNTWPESFQFPGGEWHLRNLPDFEQDAWRGRKITLIADVRGAVADDLVKAALWSSVAGENSLGFVLMQPYLPAARADRDAPLGARVYSKLLGSMDADAVIALDPHSGFITGEIRNLQVVSHNDLIRQAFDGVQIDGVIAPDAGATLRAEAAAMHLGVGIHYAKKKRDFATGKLGGFEAPTDLDFNKRYLIVDDICDGGGTFKGLAQVLYNEYGFNRDHLALWVTHGIFSGKADELRSSYRWIATTDSHPGSRRVGVATCIVPCFYSMYTTAFPTQERIDAV